MPRCLACAPAVPHSSCSVVSFNGTTLPNGHIRDRFVVQVDGAPLDAGCRTPVVRRLQEACGKLLNQAEGPIESKASAAARSAALAWWAPR